MDLLATNQKDSEIGVGELTFRYCDWLPEENGRPECYRQLSDIQKQAELNLFNASNYASVRKQLATLGKNFCEAPQKNILCYRDVAQWLSSYDSLRKSFVELAEAAVRASINIER